MSTALFLLLPATSHYTACLPLAKELEENGYGVIFAGNMSGRNIVERANFRFEYFSYMSTYNATTFRSIIGTLLVSIFNRKESRRRFREFNRSLFELDDFIKKIEPTLVFIDEHLNHYYPYIRRSISKVYIINTKLPSGKYRGVPPLNTSYLPSDNDLFNVLICELLWLKIITQKVFSRLINSVAYIGLTTEAFHKRFILKSKQSIVYTIWSCFPDYDSLINVPTIMLMSSSFNFPWKKNNSFEYFYHKWNIDHTPINDSLEQEIAAFKGKRKIIYCGIGTMPGRSTEDYARFFIQLIKFANATQEFVFVLSTAVTQLTDMLKTAGIPEHVFIYDQVAQQALLKHCDIMITHGGLNTIKECIFNTVPMLAVCNPAHRHTDTLGNIGRIIYHQIGLKCSIYDTADILRKRIEILANSNSFKDNITSLKGKMEQERLCLLKGVHSN